MDKDDILAMKPSITRYHNEISGVQALAIDRRSQHEEMIEPGAIAMMYEAYKLLENNTNPHYALTFLRTVMDQFVDVRNIMQKDETSPFQQPR